MRWPGIWLGSWRELAAELAHPVDRQAAEAGERREAGSVRRAGFHRTAAASLHAHCGIFRKVSGHGILAAVCLYIAAPSIASAAL